MSAPVGHTPGPWKVQPISETKITSPFSEESGGGYYLYGDSAGRREEGGEDQIGMIEGKADARLIAAAPDLLAALKDAHKAMYPIYWRTRNPAASAAMRAILDTAKDAIARAEGGKS